MNSVSFAECCSKINTGLDILCCMSGSSKIYLPRMKYKTITENVVVAKFLIKELRKIAKDMDNMTVYMGNFFRLYSILLTHLEKIVVNKK